MILLDIEGTTTPIAFVTQVLYPYARTHLRSYLNRYGSSPQYVALMDAFRHGGAEVVGLHLEPRVVLADMERAEGQVELPGGQVLHLELPGPLVIATNVSAGD